MTNHTSRSDGRVQIFPGGSPLESILRQHRAWRSAFDKRNRVADRTDLDESYGVAKEKLFRFGDLVYEYSVKYSAPIDSRMLEPVFSNFLDGNLKDSILSLVQVNDYLCRSHEVENPVKYRELSETAGRVLGYMRQLSFDITHPGGKTGGGR